MSKKLLQDNIFFCFSDLPWLKKIVEKKVFEIRQKMTNCGPIKMGNFRQFILFLNFTLEDKIYFHTFSLRWAFQANIF